MYPKMASNSQHWLLCATTHTIRELGLWECAISLIPHMNLNSVGF